jgi:hypothetical protein
MDTHAGSPFAGSGRGFYATGELRAGSHSVHQAPRRLICSFGGQFYTDLIAKWAHVFFDKTPAQNGRHFKTAF